MWSVIQTIQTAFNNYRPQTKFAKVMFLHMSVILCTGGGGVVSQHALQVVSQHALQPTPGRGLQVHTWGSPGSHLGGGVSRPTPRGCVCIPACTEADPPVDGYCCGRYASYWNAFLLHVYSNKIIVCILL